MNEGKTPQLRIPTAPVAPGEVRAAGERPKDIVPIAERQLKEINPEVANLLGYKAPEPRSTDPRSFEQKPAKTVDPAVAPPAPAPAAPPPPAPVVDVKPEAKSVETPTGTDPVKPAQQPQLTNQMTASQSSQPTQRPIAAPIAKQEPINAATSLAQQTAGTVAGQTTSAEKPEPQSTPQNIVKPKPFKQALPKQDDEDNVWEL